MAIIKTPLFAAQTGSKTSEWPSSVVTQGKLRVASVTIPTGTVLGAGDKVLLVRLPAGARVSPVNSVSVNGSAAATLNVGDAGDASRFAAALTGVARNTFNAYGNKPDAEMSQETTDVVATVVAGGTLTADWRIYIAFLVV